MFFRRYIYTVLTLQFIGFKNLRLASMEMYIVFLFMTYQVLIVCPLCSESEEVYRADHRKLPVIQFGTICSLRLIHQGLILLARLGM